MRHHLGVEDLLGDAAGLLEDDAAELGVGVGAEVLALLATLAAGLLSCQAEGPAQASLIRVAVVNTPDDLLRELLPEFEAQTGYKVEFIYGGDGVYEQARRGLADLVISHYGHPGVEPFLLEGLGLWPHSVFANQAALVGPPSDPAGVRGLADATEAFRRIAATRSSFVVNHNSGIKYLEELLWEGAGRPERGGSYVDLGLEGRPAIAAAAERGAYALWGLIPFRRSQGQRELQLEPLVTADPLFQRVMVAVVVRPDRVPRVNVDGAMAFQSYLIAPATQARISTFRYPGLDLQAWWPAGRHNSAAGRE